MRNSAGSDSGARNQFSGDSEAVVQADTIHGDIHVRGRAGSRLPPPRQLPMGITGFTNRAAELAALDSLRQSRRDEAEGGSVSTVVVTAIAGSPGIGKTALALHWAHSVRDHFRDGDLYVDMRGYGAVPPLLAEQALDAFLRSLGVDPEYVPVGLEERAALYRSLLNDKRVLLVIDNASSAQQVRYLLPGSRTCFALITSRSRLSGLVAREGATRVTLDILSPADSVQLLKEIAGVGRIDADPVAAARLAELCGYLPIALRVVAERMASRPQLTVPQLVDELTGEQHRLDALIADEDELMNVRAVFSWSYRALPPGQRRTFRLLSLHAGAEISGYAAAALLGMPVANARRSLQDLSGAHLLQEIRSDRYRMHDLLRAYSVERALSEESQAERTQVIRGVLTWYLLTADAARRVFLPYSHAVPLVPAGSVSESIDFHGAELAVSWFDVERLNLLDALRQAMELGQYDISWKLPVAMDGFFELGSYWNEWSQIHDIGLAAARAVGDRLGEASNLLSLGDVACGRGTYDEAARYYGQALDMSQEIGDGWLEGFALRGLGLTAEGLGRFDMAIERFRAALEVFQGHDIRRGEGMSLLSLGNCHHAKGELTTAVGFFREALSIFRDIGDRWSEAWGLGPFGMAMSELGNSAETIIHFQRAISIFHDFADNRSEATTLTRLGEVYLSRGELADALDSLGRAAGIFEHLGDPRSQEVRLRIDAVNSAGD
jgi:tetratricopeptide (TPR) repeat protein